MSGNRSGGIVYLSDVGLPDITLSDGLLTLQFFETFDDVPHAIDAIFSGTLTISTVMAPVPLPAGAWLLISGLMTAGVFGRRRTQAA